MGVTRWYGLKQETDYNEAWDSPTTILDIAECNITPEQNVNPIPSSYFPTESRWTLGNFALSGNLNTVGDTDMLGHWLVAALGNELEDQEAAYEAYQHIIWSLSPRTNGVNRPPSYKMEVGEDEKGRRQITGMLVNSLDITINKGEPVQIVPNVICAKEAIAAWAVPPTALPSDNRYVFSASQLEGYIGIDPDTNGDDAHNQVWLGMTVGAPGIEGLSININNNYPDDWFKHGSRFLQNYIVQNQEITGTITFSFESTTELKRYFGGGETPTAASPANVVDSFPAIFVINMGVSVVTSASNYFLKIYFPKLVYTSFGKPQVTRDKATIEVAFKAFAIDANDSQDLSDFDVTADAEIIEYNTGTIAVPVNEAFLVVDPSEVWFTDALVANRELAAMYCVLFNGQTSIY